MISNSSNARGARIEEIRKWAAAAPQIEWLEIDDLSLMREPAKAIGEIVEFLGTRLCLTTPMAGAIDPVLHRRKA